MKDSKRTRMSDSLTFIQFDPVNPKGSKSHAVAVQPEKPKKRLVTEEDKVNIKAVKAKGACWRCKVLKKQVCSVSTYCFIDIQD
jgi:hypothetical protein